MQTVLVIEDDLDALSIYLECLHTEGFTAIGAENGSIGVNKAQECLPDLIICDIMMPELDGYGILSLLRRDPSTAVIPIIFLSAKASKGELRRGMELGADDYLTKPCTVEEFMGAIFTCLNKRNMLEKCYAANRSDPDQPSLCQSAEHSAPQVFPVLCPRLAKVFDFLENNYDRSISLDYIAQEVGYSPAYLTNLVRKKTGRTLYAWLIERRMIAARTLLIETDQSIEIIASKIGYSNICNFFRQFRQHTGMTPKAWRDQNRTMQQSQNLKHFNQLRDQQSTEFQNHLHSPQII